MSKRKASKKVVILDIDHTVSDAAWRDDMIGAAGFTWDDYHKEAPKDKPIEEMVRLVYCLRHEFHIIAVTARPEKWRGITMAWLVNQGVMFHELIMRPDKDYSSAAALKVKLVKERIGDDLRSQVAFVLDDRDDVMAAFRAEGVTCLQVQAQMTIRAKAEEAA